MSTYGYDFPLYCLHFETQVDWTASIWDLVFFLNSKEIKRYDKADSEY